MSFPHRECTASRPRPAPAKVRRHPPATRRRTGSSVGAILNDVFRQKIEVTENGKTRRVIALEVMARRLRNDALRGDAKAIKLSIELMRRHSETKVTAVRFDELQAQDREILAQYLFEPETAKKGDGDDPDRNDTRRGGAALRVPRIPPRPVP